MKQRKNEYDHRKVEVKWRREWEKTGIYEPNFAKASRGKPFYNLMMFPYPSAEGLHVGNMYAFTGADVYGRFQRMQGKDVFEPIGLDGFGIHSENYSIKIGKHPSEQAKVSQKRFYGQLKTIGNGFSWKNTLETYDPEYYRWTQWIFLQMFKHGLAVRKKSWVNWCPNCKTVLADEQVEGGVCERCKNITTRKETKQWFFRITEYSDRLLDNIEKIDWPERIKIAQRNWIGRSAGAEVGWEISSKRLKEKKITTFTTRLDTLFGATFLVLSPEHPLVGELAVGKKVMNYVSKALLKTEQQRKEGEKEKTGVDTGYKVKHPLTGESIPIWIADFVLMEYGTGAIMGVPAHDLRDYEFAKKFKLPIKPVILSINGQVKSYLMGAERISNDELEELGAVIFERTKEGHRKILIPKASVKKYEKLVEEKISPGFWNEYLGKETKFIFKEKDSSIHKMTLTPGNEEFIDKLAVRFNKEERGRESVWKWLSENDWYKDVLIHTEYGILINSGDFNGLSSEEAQGKILLALKEKGLGRKKTTYHLRDWLISRQRYWGPPIPMLECKECGWQPVPEEDLPVELPYIKDYKPTGDGKSPLDKAPISWLTTECPGCGGKAKRETDVSDTFLDSAWYFLAYPNLRTKEWGGPTTAVRDARARRAQDDASDLMSVSDTSSGGINGPFNKSITRRWLPVDAYVGGAEHAVLHLLYSRFVTMALHDWGYLEFEEPFPFLFSHGLIIKDGAKMSKSRGNTVIPDEYISKYGSDTLRTYLMFLGRYDLGGDFRDSGIAGMKRFLNRIWRLYQENLKLKTKDSDKKLLRLLHRTIKKVTEDIEKFKYNTAIAAMMEFVNEWEGVLRLSGSLQRSTSAQDDKAGLVNVPALSNEDKIKFLKLLAPFAPHMSEEIYQSLLNSKLKTKDREVFESIHTELWPGWDEKLVKLDEVEIPIQINGKLRGTVVVSFDKAKEKDGVIKLAKKQERVAKYLKGKKIRKTVWVPGRLLNFVV
jgi:leucyl-tRNA synthetase